MTTYTDVMVDCETTGTLPDRNALLQISAVRFNLKERTVDPEFFNQCLTIPPWRSWDQGTISWWNRQPQVLQSILQRAQPADKVINDFAEWAYPAGWLRFWSKPSHFDFMFLSSYFNDYGLANPFHYREAMDVNSFLRGIYYPNKPDDSIKTEMSGPAHDALNDTLWQLKHLFAHVDNVKEKVNATSQATLLNTDDKP